MPILKMFHEPEMGVLDKLNIVYIYEAEAHATDVWFIGKSAGAFNKRHLTIEDRANCARQFIDEFDLTCLNMYLDAIDDSFLHTFSAWPFKYFIIEYDKDIDSYRFHHIGDPDDSSFDLMEILDIIKA